MKVRFLAIRLMEWHQTEYVGWQESPALFRVKNDGLPLDDPERRFYHGDTASYQPIDMDHARIEKDYGLVREEDDDAKDKIAIQFARDWPPEKVAFGGPVPRTPGWIAPNGDYYPCRAWEHIGLAGHIGLVLWGEYKTRLEDEGWIAVRDEVLGMPPGEITERQRTTLYNVWTSEVEREPQFPEWQITKEKRSPIYRRIRELTGIDKGEELGL